MKRLVGMLTIVAALCMVLAIPAGAAKPVEVNGTVSWGDCGAPELRPIGKGGDDHYCLVSVDCTHKLEGDVNGTMPLHYEVLKRGPCEPGPASFPSVQRAWATFKGEIRDGEQIHVGTCKTFFHGGWYWVEDGVLGYAGRFSLHACAGGLAGAHAQLEVLPDDIHYAGTAFFSGEP